MKLLKFVLFLAIWPFLLTGCITSYKKIDGRWAYVTYDEGNWGDKHYLDVVNEAFEVLDDKRYAKDHTKVFFEGRLIKGADSNSFKIIGGDYSADGYQVYLREYALIDAEPKSFKRLKGSYSCDKKYVFCGTVPIKVEEMKSFKVTKTTDTYLIESSKIFVAENPDYAWIDTQSYEYVIFSHDEAKTMTEKFKGFKKQNLL